MPGSGEFTIGSSVGVVTRTGIKADKTVRILKGARDDIAAATASQPVADQFFASKLGLMQKCIGIQWIGPIFFAGTGQTSAGGGLLPLPWTGTGGAAASSDSLILVNDTGQFGTFNTTEDTIDNAWFGGSAIRGITNDGTDVSFVGGHHSVQVNIDPSNANILVPVQAACIAKSTDKGKTWSDGKFPAQPTDEGIDSKTGDLLTLYSYVGSLAYDPQAKTFLAGVMLLGDKSGWSSKWYTNDGTSRGWQSTGEVKSWAITELRAPPLPPWTPGSKVCDTAKVISLDVVAGKFTGIFQNASSIVKYVSVCGPGQTMDLGNGKKLRWNGKFVTSECEDDAGNRLTTEYTLNPERGPILFNDKQISDAIGPAVCVFA
jgi:hypothetical protein